jgi:purine-binding chemotaxis protein CheW
VSDPSARLSLFPSATPSRVGQGTRGDEPEITIRDFLAFVVTDSLYAIDLGAVTKVIKLPEVTEVPLAPEPVLGIISVRGQVTTLFDARRLLRLPPADPTARSRVLLVSREEETVGLLVDSVFRVYRLEDNEIEPPEAAGAERQPHVIGIGRPERKDAAVSPEGDSGGESLFYEPMLSETVKPEGDEVLILLDPAALLKECDRNA